jgi:hypothetical protein
LQSRSRMQFETRGVVTSRASVALATIEPWTQAPHYQDAPQYARLRRAHARAAAQAQHGTAITPAVRAAALDPALPSGIDCVCSSMGGMVRFRSPAMRSAVCQIKLSRRRKWKASRPVTRIDFSAVLNGTQINSQSQAQSVNRTQIGTGCGNSQFAEAKQLFDTEASNPARCNYERYHH